MIGFLLSPVGRWVAVAWAGIIALCGAYMIGHDRGAKSEAAAAARDALRRAESAIIAGDSVDVSADRLREPDRNRRD